MEEADAVTDDMRHVAIDNGATDVCALHGFPCVVTQHAERRRWRQQGHIQGRTEPVLRVKSRWAMRMSRTLVRSLTSQTRRKIGRCVPCRQHDTHAPCHRHGVHALCRSLGPSTSLTVRVHTTCVVNEQVKRDLQQFGIYRALPVYGEPDFASGPPTTAEEYLRRVRCFGDKRRGSAPDHSSMLLRTSASAFSRVWWRWHIKPQETRAS